MVFEIFCFVSHNMSNIDLYYIYIEMAANRPTEMLITSHNIHFLYKCVYNYAYTEGSNHM